MLRQLTINDYAIVDNLDIALSPGMTVITGETGAGKSIMLDALGLALGDRADKDVIREGADAADISACFDVADSPTALAWIAEHDFSDGEDRECILRRVVTREGRSRGYINGRPTTLGDLRELGDMLIDIHSQHEHQSLLKAGTARRLLDEYCAGQDLAGRVERTAAEWRRVRQEIEALSRQAEENDAQYQLLSYQVQELEELGLEDGEPAALAREHEQLSHAESSLDALRQVLALCTEDEEANIRQSLNRALHLLEDLPEGNRPLEEAAGMLETARIQVEEAAGELSRALDRIELNPERLAEVDRRLGQIHQIARKHKVQADELPALQHELRGRLDEMGSAGERIETLRGQLQALEDDWQRDAAALSEARGKGARELAEAVNAQLAGLGMEGAEFQAALSPRPEDTPHPGGRESIEFLVSTNAGQTPRPLARIASGGELSRISLAIQVVTARTSAIPTLVFDEVDVGIGGGVARSVGELLRTLGETGQVICVTHQPQVASQGHHHLSVSKHSSGADTVARIRALEPHERVEEVARMLGGDELTDQSVAHAREMMA